MIPYGNKEVLNFVKEHNIDYTFVSADQPLANGVIDIVAGMPS